MTPDELAVLELLSKRYEDRDESPHRLIAAVLEERDDLLAACNIALFYQQQLPYGVAIMLDSAIKKATRGQG